MNYAYMLCFEPTPIWRKNDDDWYLRLDNSSPNYKKGSLSKLINKDNINLQEKQCIIIINEDGYGSYEDLETLKADLTENGFIYSIVSFNR
jgi:DNA transposition AAA+ family ATPase